MKLAKRSPIGVAAFRMGYCNDPKVELTYLIYVKRSILGGDIFDQFDQNGLVRREKALKICGEVSVLPWR